MKKFTQAALLAATLLPAYASAADFNYNYVQASYISSDIAGTDGDGIALDGSFALNKDVAFVVGYETTSYEEFGDSLDVDTLAVGVAFHSTVNEQMDTVFSVGLLDSELSINAPGFLVGTGDDTGTFLSAGVRLQSNPQMELGLGLKYFDVFDETNTGLEASLLFNIDKKNQLGITFSNASTLDEVDNLFFRFRSNF